MRRYVSGIVAASVFALAACGSDVEKIENRDSVKPATPKGSVHGVITNGLREALDGATVEIQVGEKLLETTTDEEGRFAFTGLPAGSTLGLKLSKEGYGTAQLNVTLPNSAGKYPLDDASVFVGPISLFELSGSFEVEVMTASGHPVTPKGALCGTGPGWSNWSSGSEAIVDEVRFFDAEASEGRIRCTGLPSETDRLRAMIPAAVIVPPQDFDGDGHPDTEHAERILFADLEASSPLILPEWGEPVELLGSNAPLMGEDPAERLLEPDEAITLVFNQPVTVRTARYIDEDEEIHPLEGTLSPYKNRVTLQPPGDGWPEGRGVFVEIVVSSTARPDQIEAFGGEIAFRSEDPAEVIRSGFEDDGSEEMEAGEILVLQFDKYIRDLEGDLPFFVDADLNNSGDIGDSWGELGYKDPYWLQSTPQFVSGFSDSYEYVWGGSTVEAGTDIVIAFSRLIGDDTIFGPDGKPITEDLRVRLRAYPAP